jgi:hypothetical protein
MIQRESHKHQLAFSVEEHGPPVLALMMPHDAKIYSTIGMWVVIDQKIMIMHISKPNHGAEAECLELECAYYDRTTSKMRGLPPKIDKRILDEARMHKHDTQA